jgi:hypothetical protein
VTRKASHDLERRSPDGDGFVINNSVSWGLYSLTFVRFPFGINSERFENLGLRTLSEMIGQVRSEWCSGFISPAEKYYDVDT